MQKSDKYRAQNIKKSIAMQKVTEVLAAPESITNAGEERRNINLTPEKQPNSQPVEPAPHLAQRMVHPALLPGGAKIMNLGSAAQRFGSENIVLSPQSQARRSSLENTPSERQSDSQRPFSLAEAMQAARRLNVEQPRLASQEADQDDITLHDHNDDVAVNSTDVKRNITPEPEDENSANLTEDLKESDQNEPAEQYSDNAKNIEIRRLSNTDEGNKVLEPSFHSPEKDAKKNPLQNIFKIVSGMEIPTSSDEVGEGRLSANSRNSSPGLRGGIPSPGLGLIRPQLKGRKTKQYSSLPPLPHSPPAWVVGGPNSHLHHNLRGIRPAAQPLAQPLASLPVQPAQIMVTPPQVQLSGPAVQPMYQMVQTVNGTMLVQINQPLAVENQTFLQLQPAQTSPASSGSSSKSSSPGSASSESPTSKKKSRKRKLAEASSSTGGQPPPLLLSPPTNPAVLQTFQPSPVAASPAQPQLVFSQPQSGGNMMTPAQVLPQNILVNPPNQQMILAANGTLMAVPQVPQVAQVPPAPGIMYQQMADGTLLQMVAPPSQQLVLNTPQLILTPGGLMQTLAPLPPVQEVNKQLSPGFTAQRKRTRESKKSRAKKKMKASSSDTSLEQEGCEGVDETDTSFEDPQPSTSKSSIQSNQVDSSGLNATPPHYKEAEFEQLRSCSPGFDESYQEQDLNSSLDTSRHSKLSGASTPASNISLAEEKLTDYDSDLDIDIQPGPRISKAVSSSSKKKKKKKKRSRHTTSPGSQQKQFALSDIVWGPVNGSPSWPGKIVSEDEDRSKVWVCWFVSRQVSQIDVSKLKTLTQGLEDHHKERKNSRR